MPDGSDDCRAFEDTDSASQEVSLFETVPHEIPATIAKALAHRNVPWRLPVQQCISHRPRFSPTGFMAETGENSIASTTAFTWMEFQERFAMISDSLRQVEPGQRMATAPMGRFYEAVVSATSRMRFCKLSAFFKALIRLVQNDVVYCQGRRGYRRFAPTGIYLYELELGRSFPIVKIRVGQSLIPFKMP
jgi:hypothetical protein